jgi:hypothetical protein
MSTGVAKKAVKDRMNEKHIKQWESITGLKTGKGTDIRTLYQKIQESIEAG